MMNKTRAISTSSLTLVCCLAISACNSLDFSPKSNPASPAGDFSITSSGQDLDPWQQDAFAGEKHGQYAIAGPFRLYFTQPNSPDDPEGRVKDIIYALIGIIDNSKKDLAIAIYMLDLDEVADAILAANRRGVRVRVVTDRDSLNESATMQRLQNAGISIVADRSQALMHNKFMVVDEKAVWSGSYNWTPSCTYRNDNDAIYIESSQLAEDYLQEFDEMYYNKHFGEEKKTRVPYPYLTVDDASIEVCFSPPGRCAQKVVQAVTGAQKSIRFMTFAFTSDPIAEALKARHRAGIDISGVIETYQADKPGGDYAAFRSLNMDVLLDGNPYNMHHKVFVLDEMTVILGSFNFTRSADTANDENLLLIDDRDLAGLFLDEFERVYAQAQNPAR